VVTADKVSEIQATDLRLQRARNINDSNLNDFPHITHHSSLITHHSVFISVLVLTILSAFLFFYRLAERDLWSSHEGRAAQDAETILEDGHWGLPRLFDRKYVDLQKPPLYYWLVAAVAFIRGRPVDEWAVRLPSALAAAGSGLLLYWFGVHRGRPRAALAAALILITAVHYTWLARVGRIDMPLTLAMSVAVICFYAGWYPSKRKRRSAAHSKKNMALVSRGLCFSCNRHPAQRSCRAGAPSRCGYCLALHRR
jgi:hypothetical protein